jgi:hypothetical protein
LKPNWKLSPARQILLDFFLVFLLAAVLIRPYFKAKYMDRWPSIESTFIADARFLLAHGPSPQWQPLWYGGTRFDYVYPPALRYGTALISKVTGFWPVKAYHFYVAFFYAIGIAAVYLLIRVGSGSRRGAYLGAAASALMSPVFLILPSYRHGSWMHQPLRLWVLNAYGEGPHMTALALLPIALAFSWLALEKRRPWAVALAAMFAAAAVSNNFYGATALAIFYPILVWSFWVTRRDRRMFPSAVAIPALAYGLTAFWLVPSYLTITTENMKYVSNSGGNAWSIVLAVVVAIAFAALTARWARGKQELTWLVFVAGSAVFFSLNVLGSMWFHLQITGQPHRLLPELDMIYIMAAVIVLRWLWNRPGMATRAAVAVVIAGGFFTARGYVRHAWQAFPLAPDYQNRIEYQVSDWMWKNMPGARAFTAGSVRFWYDVWHDLPQVGGGSDQGLMNPMVPAASWELVTGKDARASILWMQALGGDAIAVSDERSEEVYKDYKAPRKFAGVLPVLYDNNRGDVIYSVPRRYRVHVRVVDAGKLRAARLHDGPVGLEHLQAYVDAIEQGPESPATLTHQGTDRIEVRANLAPGQVVVVQETYDSAWHAWSDGQPVPVRRDPMNLMELDPPPGNREISLAFVTPLENQVGRALTAIALAVVLALLWFGWRRGKSEA